VEASPYESSGEASFTVDDRGDAATLTFTTDQAVLRGPDGFEEQGPLAVAVDCARVARS
jgi:hypothetical protein